MSVKSRQRKYLKKGSPTHWGIGEIDGLLVPPGKASNLLTDHLITKKHTKTLLETLFISASVIFVCKYACICLMLPRMWTESNKEFCIVLYCIVLITG